MKHTVQVEVGGRPLIFETGEVARQAGGSVLMRYGDTVVIVAATKGGPGKGRNRFPAAHRWTTTR